MHLTTTRRELGLTEAEYNFLSQHKHTNEAIKFINTKIDNLEEILRAKFEDDYCNYPEIEDFIWNKALELIRNNN